jgi:transcriptional regulator with XRE-family HTH domain
MVTASVMMEPVRIHELLGAGIRAARQRQGWRQQDASREFRRAGLRTWTPVAVGQVENGTRKPSIGELLLACYALQCSLAELVPTDVDEMVDMGVGATMTAGAIRSLLSGINPGDLRRDEIYTPGDAWWAEFYRRSAAERDRVKPLLDRVFAGADNEMTGHDELAALRTPTEAESRAAERLKIEPVVLKGAARRLWKRDFEEERDARAGEPDDLTPQTLQARRGHATRAMLAELRAFLDERFGTGGEER